MHGAGAWREDALAIGVPDDHPTVLVGFDAHIRLEPALRAVRRDVTEGEGE